MSLLRTLRRYKTDVGGTGIHYLDGSAPLNIIDPTTTTGTGVSAGSVSVVSAAHPEGGTAQMLQFARSSGTGTAYLDVPCQAVTPWTMGDAPGHFELWIYVDTIPQHSTPAGPSPDTTSGGLTSFPPVVNVKLRNTADSSGFSPATSFRIRKGWNRVVIPHGDFSAYGSASWSTFAPDFARFSFIAVGTLVYTVKIAAFRFRAYRRPVVVNIFDDCRIGVNTYAVPYFAAHGVKGTMGVVGQLITGENLKPGGSSITADGGVNFMTVAQIQAAEAAGWDSLNHSHTHFGQMHGYTYAEFEDEIVRCNAAMASANLGRNNLHNRAMVAVGGGQSVTMFSVLQTYGYNYCGKASASTSTNERDSWHQAHPYLRERFDTGSFEYNGGGTAKVVTDTNGPVDFIKQNRDRGGPSVLMWHNILAGAATSTITNSNAFFQNAMEYQLQGNGNQWDILTLGEYLDLLEPGLLGVDSVTAS